MINVNLIKLQHFFEVDNKIKKEMYNNVPPTINGYLDNESICRYTNNLEDSLTYIFSELKCIALDIFNGDFLVLKKIEELENTIKTNFYSCGLDIDKLRNFYKKYISNMDISFIKEVKNKCVGYANSDIPIDMVSSINEMLHLVHSYVLNNENILQSIPKIAEKQNNCDYSITLRGENSKLFNELYEKFPNDLDVGWTDMVTINDKKMLMMVRDRGHALTIEITTNSDKARIEYFIPKLCNIDMINNLEGVNKVNNDSVGTTGVIETDINNLQKNLFNFISKVPTDNDIVEYKKIL